MPLDLFGDEMPELPEVETIRRGLERHIVGARVRGVEVVEPRLRRPVDVTSLERAIGRRITAVDRRAKYLVVDLDGELALILHLGMSGRILLTTPGAPRQPHVHVVWTLAARSPEPAREIHFRDPRRFGVVEVTERSEVAAHPLLAGLGPEPLDPRTTAEDLAERARGSRRPIKSFLMDSRAIAGVGNIYASEALWLSRIHPRARAGRLSSTRWARLLESLRRVLHDAIEAGGTTLADYRDQNGNLGYFAVELRAYGREGLPCPTCNAEIRRAELGGRSTFYCPRCQRI